MPTIKTYSCFALWQYTQIFYMKKIFLAFKIHKKLKIHYKIGQLNCMRLAKKLFIGIV